MSRSPRPCGYQGRNRRGGSGRGGRGQAARGRMRSRSTGRLQEAPSGVVAGRGRGAPRPLPEDAGRLRQLSQAGRARAWRGPQVRCSRLLREVVGIVDNLERAIAAEGVSRICRQGVAMILRQMEDVLSARASPGSRPSGSRSIPRCTRRCRGSRIQRFGSHGVEEFQPATCARSTAAAAIVEWRCRQDRQSAPRTDEAPADRRERRLAVLKAKDDVPRILGIDFGTPTACVAVVDVAAPRVLSESRR